MNNPTKKNYKKPPIVEAIIEIRFKQIEKKVDKLFDKFYDKIKDNYPKKQNQFLTEIKFDNNPTTEPELTQNQKNIGFRLIHKNKKKY